MWRYFIRLTMVFVLSAALLSCTSENRNSDPSETIEISQEAQSIDPDRKNLLVTSEAFESTLMSEAVQYHLYLPTSYHSNSQETYPVLYWLHGSGGFPPGALNMLSNRFDNAIQAQKIPEMIVVFPDGYGQAMWVNAKDGSLPLEDIIIQELIPHIDKTYRTIRRRDGRLLEGGSMGGYGAARFGILYPAYFSGISMINPGPMQEALDVKKAPIVGREGAQKVMDNVYGGDIEYFKSQSPWRLIETQAESVIQSGLHIRLIVGENDPITPVNLAFSERLKTFGVEHDVSILSNAGHNPRQMFAAMGEDYWSFFRADSVK